MQKLYTGKTKDVYKREDGLYQLAFKDDVTGVDGVFDPGANTVGLSMEGAGRAALALTTYFYTKINEAGIPTHFVSANLDDQTLVVKPAALFGQGVEVILRYKAVGSFLRRYGKYIEEGADLDHFVEVTLKDDERDDPPITRDALAMLGIMSDEDYDQLKSMTIKIGDMVRDELKKKDLDLYDIKFEFGLIDGEVALIDEISGGNMRAYHHGEYVEPLILEKMMLE